MRIQKVYCFTLLFTIVTVLGRASQCPMVTLTLGGFHNLEAGMPWFVQDGHFPKSSALPRHWIAKDRNGPDFKVISAHYGGDDGYWVFDTSRLKAGHEYELYAGTSSFCTFTNCGEFPFRLNIQPRQDRSDEEITVGITNISGEFADPHYPYPGAYSSGFGSPNTLTLKVYGAIASPGIWLARLDVLGDSGSIESSSVGAVRPSHPYDKQSWEFTLWGPIGCGSASTRFIFARGKRHRIYLYDGSDAELAPRVGIEFTWLAPDPLPKEVAEKMDELRMLQQAHLDRNSSQTQKAIQDWTNANRDWLGEHNRWRNRWGLMYSDSIPARIINAEDIPALHPTP